MATVEEFKAAWAAGKDPEHRAAALAVAQAYCADNASTLDPILGDKSSDELVKLIDLAKLADQRDQATVIKMYELVKFERKQIGGTFNIVVPPAPRERGGDRD